MLVMYLKQLEQGETMTKDEALKLALEALKQIDEAMPFPVAKLAQASIKEALAQPQRTWVGLTAKEKHEFRYSHMTTADFIDAIEAKLKEKNTSGQE